MGFNTTLVVMNDALDDIENDPEFGKNLGRAANQIWNPGRKPVDVPALGHINAATVLESHHADRYVAVAIGGNRGVVLGDCGSWRGDNEVDMLRYLADKYGYNLHKKRDRT